ncbi:PREDICTED: uncharacterized protein LOC108975644 [Bactrocera latifrons]|uniref:uncharacterized protein LOC108975644 n=1 Tax=Bactrocera latifrons TaxID=174628 RepID=UPI0008DE5CD1|nr:PREDICTED: uncharacterized protein LOC108975644 [Bactrocera latifrons]
MFCLRKKEFLLMCFLQTLVICLTYTMENSPDSLEKEMLTDCLMQLNISELLRLQRSLERLPELHEKEDFESNLNNEFNKTTNDSGVCDLPNENNKNSTCVSPQALPITAEKRGYEHHLWQPEEKPSKLQTLFHITITALAFLSFGGYLLCLIVQAIRSKGTTYFHPAATTAVTNTNGGVKRIKIYRRSRRRVHSTPNEVHAYMAYY